MADENSLISFNISFSFFIYFSLVLRKQSCCFYYQNLILKQKGLVNKLYSSLIILAKQPQQYCNNAFISVYTASRMIDYYRTSLS